jgi:glycosyltransferase involved in cell wall biosynthesis
VVAEPAVAGSGHPMGDDDLVPARIRVAVDATPLLGHRTGVGVFCLGALQALSARPNLELRAFAVSWRRRSGIANHLPATVGSSHRPMPARPVHALWKHSQLPPIEWFTGAVDVVHGTNFEVPPSRRAARVCSVHDLTPLHHPEFCNRATLSYPHLIRRALRRGAWVHTDSEFVRAEVLEAFAADPQRVRVVHPGVPELPPVDPPALAQLDQRWPVTAGRRLVLAVGTAEPRKDLPGLVGAFDQVAARHDDVALVLAGPPGWGEAALHEAIGRAAAAPRIVQTGWVGDDTLAALMSRASLLAYPSRYEGFGFPPLQAMAAGVPVVATRAGSLPEVLGDAACLVDVDDEAALVDAMLRLLEDAALRDRLTQAGRQQAAHYRWEGCGEGLEALYRDVWAERHG